MIKRFITWIKQYPTLFFIASLPTVGALLVIQSPGFELTPQPQARFGEIQALVEHGTFDLSESSFDTIDKLKLKEQFLAIKSPNLQLYGAAIYGFFYYGMGLSFQNHPILVISLITFFTSILAHILLNISLFQILSHWQASRRDQTLMFLVFNIGYLGAGYSSALNNHSIAGAVIFWAFVQYILLKETETPSKKCVFCYGLALGIIPTLDYPSFVFSTVIFLLSLPWLINKASIRGVFLLGCLIPLGTHFLAMYFKTGQFLPLVYLMVENPEVVQFKGSYWQGEARQQFDLLELPAYRQSKWLNLFHTLFGHHGMFSMTPFLGIGLWAAMRRLKSLVSNEAIVLFCFFTVYSIYIYKNNSYGGVCVGFRFMVPYMPLLLLFVYFWLKKSGARTSRKIIFYILLIVSGFNTINALPNPFKHSLWQKTFWPMAHLTQTIKSERHK